MYLSPSDIHATRLRALDNLHLASRAWVDTTEKLAALALRSGRQALDESQSQFAELAEGAHFQFKPLPLERLNAWRSNSAMLFSDYFEIVGDAQQAILHMAKDQMATFDKVLLRQMDHAALSADAAGESAIDHIKTAIRQAEDGFNEVADAAARNADLVEEQLRHVSDALVIDADSDPATTQAATAPRSRKPRAG